MTAVIVIFIIGALVALAIALAAACSHGRRTPPMPWSPFDDAHQADIDEARDYGGRT